jgi:hypothetical protein
MNNLIERCEGIVQAEFDGQTVMMSIENGKYYGLNEVASRIWALIEQPTNEQDICDALHRDYTAATNQISDDVRVLINDMMEKRIIQMA